MFHLRYPKSVLFAICAGTSSAGVAGNVTADADGFAPSWVNDSGARGTWTIVYSSALTLFLSAWVSLHLNIPRYRESKTSMIFRLGFWGSTSFLFPEVIVWSALLQWLEVHRFRKHFEGVRQGLVNNPGSNVNHTVSDPFSKLYAWYILMGGVCVQVSANPNYGNFTLSIEENAKEATKNGRLTVSRHGIAHLARHGYYFEISDESIKDKTKADSLAKLLAFAQVLWFVSQVVQRKVAGLPISLLEYHVLVNIACGLIIYSLWFSKPRNVETATSEEAFSIGGVISSMMDRTGYSSLPKLCFQTWYDSEHETSKLRRAAMWLCQEKDARIDAGSNGLSTIFVVQGSSVVVCILEEHPREDVAAKALSERLDKALVGASAKQPRGDHAKGEDGVGCVSVALDSSAIYFAKTERARSLSCPPTITATTEEFSPHPPPANFPQPQPQHDEGEVLKSPSNTVVNTRNSIAPSQERVALGGHQKRVFSMIRIHSKCFTAHQRNWRGRDYVDKEERAWIRIANYAGFPLALLGYGGIHLIPSLVGFNFPSSAEKVLWNAACYVILGIIIGAPLTMAAMIVYDKIGVRLRSWRRVRGIAVALSVALWCVYPAAHLAARLYLMVESFISLRKERIEIFQTPGWNWLDYIPHI